MPEETSAPSDPNDSKPKGRFPLEDHPRLREFINYALPTCGGIAALVLAINYPMLVLYIGVTLALIAPSVLLHEWGHYYVARRAGLEVKEFSIGFGKRLWSRKSAKTGVLWSIKALPFGGSVEVAGMTVEQTEKEETPREKAYIFARARTRIRLTTFGPLMNFILAWIALTIASFILAPEEAGVGMTLLLAPINGIAVLFGFILLSLRSLWSVFANWSGSDVGSILSMPNALETGVAHASESGMSIGLYMVLVFALLNLSLGLFNSLPLFPLDGYHTMVAFVDGVRSRVAKRKGRSSKPLTQKQLSWYTKVSGGAVACFVVLVILKDVTQAF